jgi:hypothetical protein
MKNTILLLLFLCSLFGCKKDPFDYRTKYLGDYNFVIHYDSWNPLSGHIDTTYSKDGKIDYGSDENTIFIFFNGSIADELTVYEDGTIGDNYFKGGEFETTNKIKYSYYWGSQGSATYGKVTGEKK